MKGEQVIINEEVKFQTGIKDITVYTTEDIKAVFQDSDGLNNNIATNFVANTVLHEVALPNFAKTDMLTITGSTTTELVKLVEDSSVEILVSKKEELLSIRMETQIQFMLILAQLLQMEPVLV